MKIPGAGAKYGWIVILLLQTTATGQIAISVAPTVVNETIPAGSQQKYEMNLFNELEQDIDVMTMVTGLKLNQEGLPYPVSKDDKWSCANWISIVPETFIIKGHEHEIVEARINIPKNVKGGKYAIVLFDVKTNNKKPQTGVQIKGQLGTIFMLEIDRTQNKNGTVLKNDIVKKNGTTIFSTVFQNTGNSHVKVSGSVVLRDSLTRVVDRVPLNCGTGTVLPESQRTFIGTWENKRNIKPGEYIAEFRVSFPGNRLNLDEMMNFTISR